jgi:hypothetical protein
MAVRKKAIVCDIDDCIISFIGFVLKSYNAKYGTCISPSDLTTWDFVDVNITDARGTTVNGKELRDYFKMTESHGLYAALDAIPGGKDLIDYARALNYKVILLTARPEEFRIQTELSLIRNNITVDELIFNWDKCKVINDLSEKYIIHAFMDDKLETVESVFKNCNVKHTFLVSKAYNLNLKITEGIIRIADPFDSAKVLR